MQREFATRQRYARTDVSRPCTARGQQARLVELRKQLCARLHTGRNSLLDMIEECCHSLHQGLVTCRYRMLST